MIHTHYTLITLVIFKNIILYVTFNRNDKPRGYSIIKIVNNKNVIVLCIFTIIIDKKIIDLSSRLMQK